MCWAQSMDSGNPRIALRKAWIHAMRNNPWIARSIRGSRKAKGAKYGFEDNPWTGLRKSPIVLHTL